MCGIAGIINFSGRAVDENTLTQMLDVATHRGPDYSSHKIWGSVGLGHNRLSVVDLDDRSNQPMSYINQRYWIVYNGEVYNYLELKQELFALGYHFSTESDTEVILAAYACWGEKCLHKFNGMFAFAVFDYETREFFIARDRFGIKPLVYYESEDRFVFASEIKQVLPVLPKVAANEERFLDYFLVGYENHTDETFFSGVHQLLPGHFIKISLNNNQKIVRQYYELKSDPSITQLGISDSTELVKSLLRDSIRLRLRADVQVGTCLSGGLDSSLISHIASDIYSKEAENQFMGFHARSTERVSDESSMAKQVADAADIDLHIVTPSTADFHEQSEELVMTQEEPFGGPSMYMGWHVFEDARKNGCTVMLNGQGADELFLGYERYFALELNPYRPLDFLWKAYLQSQNSRLSLSRAIANYFYFKAGFLRRARIALNPFVLPRRKKRFNEEFVKHSASSYGDERRFQKLEIESLQLPHLLRYEDRNSMRHSIETRLPFMDYRLVEAAVNLPTNSKIYRGWSKYVLRQVADDVLPKNITWRKEKLGFEAPASTWFESSKPFMINEISNSDFLASYIDIQKCIRNFDSIPPRYKWAFFNSALWARVFNVDT